MHWLSLGSAWLALSCLLIIAMYILKKRYEPRNISSHLLWRQVLQEQEANRPWQRLKNLLLLWLQLLIAILIVLALMEPAVEKELTRDTHAVILLDRSASMATSEAERGETYLEKAKQELLDWIDRQWDGGAVTLVVNGQYPTIALSHESDKQRLTQGIKSVEPYYGISDDETALSLAQALAGHNDQAYLHYYVDERFKLIQETVDQTAAYREQWHLYDSTLTGYDDRIRSFTLTQASDAEQQVNGFVTVLHETNRQQELELAVTAYNERGSVMIEQRYTNRADSSGMTIFTIHDLPQAQYYAAELIPLASDPNSFNNKQYSLLTAEQTYQALLVSEGNLFLEKAMQLMNVGMTKIASSAEAPGAELLSDIHFIIVDGSYAQLAQKEEWRVILEQYPLWVIDDPDRSQAAALTNEPAAVHEHPVTQYFNMDDVYISLVAAISSQELSSTDVVVEYGGAPAILAGMRAQKPYLRYAFSLQYSDLPLRAAFPVLVMNSVEYLVSGSAHQLGSMLVEAEPTLSLSAQTSSSYWKRLDQADSGQAMRYTSAVTAPSIPGVYALIEEDERGQVIQQRTAVIQADSSEFASPNIAAIVHDYEGNQQMGERNAGLSKLTAWLAAILLLVLVLEWEVYRRGI